MPMMTWNCPYITTLAFNTSRKASWQLPSGLVESIKRCNMYLPVLYMVQHPVMSEQWPEQWSTSSTMHPFPHILQRPLGSYKMHLTLFTSTNLFSSKEMYENTSKCPRSIWWNIISLWFVPKGPWMAIALKYLSSFISIVLRKGTTPVIKRIILSKWSNTFTAMKQSIHSMPFLIGQQPCLKTPRDQTQTILVT